MTTEAVCSTDEMALTHLLAVSDLERAPFIVTCGARRCIERTAARPACFPSWAGGCYW